MAKIQVKNLADLERILKNQVANKLYSNSAVENEIARVIHDKVQEVVYDAYEPKHYDRRGDNDGLSDVGNMQFSDISINGSKIHLKFENETLGHLTKAVMGKPITDTIEEGIVKNWFDSKTKQESEDYEAQEWMKPRPFVAETAKELNNNPSILNNALKQDLKEMGFDVK